LGIKATALSSHAFTLVGFSNYRQMKVAKKLNQAEGPSENI